MSSNKTIEYKYNDEILVIIEKKDNMYNVYWKYLESSKKHYMFGLPVESINEKYLIKIVNADLDYYLEGHVYEEDN